MQLRLVLDSYKSPPTLSVNGSTSLPQEPLILEYTNPELRKQLYELLELERTTITSRKQVLSELVRHFNATLNPLSEANARTHLTNKYPEYFL